MTQCARLKVFRGATPAAGRFDAHDVPFEAGQSVLQILPINEMPPVERSPYSAMSAMALDPIYISLPRVIDFAGLGGELVDEAGGEDRRAVDPGPDALVGGEHVVPGREGEVFDGLDAHAQAAFSRAAARCSSVS